MADTRNPITPEQVSQRIEKAREIALRKSKSATYECAQATISALGYNVDIKSDEDMRRAINGLAAPQRKQVREIIRTHGLDVDSACVDATKGKVSGLVQLPAKLVTNIVKGGVRGAGIAGIVNNFAPGLYSTLAGFLAAKTPALWAKLGALGVGVFTPIAVQNGIVIGAGALLGAILYTGGKTIVGIAKSIKERKERKERRNIVSLDETR